MDVWELLSELDREMTSMDINLMEWQGHLDMAALSCLDMTIYNAEVQMELPLPITVKRVPLVRYTEGERKVIGVAELDVDENVIKATVDTDDAEILAMANIGAFSLVDEDPPVLNHEEIRAQLREMIHPYMYRNNFKFPDHPFNWDEHIHLDRKDPKLKMMHKGEWREIEDVPESILDNHPFFKKEQ